MERVVVGKHYVSGVGDRTAAAEEENVERSGRLGVGRS